MFSKVWAEADLYLLTLMEPIPCRWSHTTYCMKFITTKGW